MTLHEFYVEHPDSIKSLMHSKTISYNVNYSRVKLEDKESGAKILKILYHFYYHLYYRFKMKLPREGGNFINHFCCWNVVKTHLGRCPALY